MIDHRPPIGEPVTRRPAQLVVVAVIASASMMAAGAAAVSTSIYSPPACQTVTFHSEPKLFPQRACMNVGVHSRRTEKGSYLFLTPDHTGIGIFRDNGTLVWWKERPVGTTEEHDATVVHLWGRRFLAAWAGTAHLIGHPGVTINTGTFLLYNDHYQRVGDITAGPPFAPNQIDMHEFRITPQGDALVGIYDPVNTMVHGQHRDVVQYVVQKLSLVRTPTGIHTGKVLFQWSSLKGVPVSRSYLPDAGRHAAWDYFHGNGIDQDSDGNLIVSARNTWGVYKISVLTGRILWEVGGRGDHQLKLPWCYQHDVSALSNHEYSAFDDGAVGPGCVGARSWHPSRGVIFRVNPSPKPAEVTLVKAYTHHPAIHAEYEGGMQRLSNGNVLVGWGTVPEVTQYNAAGRVVMDLSLSQQSYRGYRFSWVGLPSSRPSVAGRLQGSGTDVWASWNGSTTVAAWQALGGSTSRLLAPVGAPAHRTGFETKISLRQQFAYVAVRALSPTGQVLATSQTVKTD